MAFGNQYKSKGGSKKGPRAHQLSHKNKQVKLRPQPEKPFGEAKNDRDKSGLLGTEGQLLNPNEEDQEEESEEEEEEEECSYRKETQIKNNKPLIGKCLSVSGCLGLKADLLHKATELGSMVESSLLNHVTHLITDSTGSDKYEVSKKTIFSFSFFPFRFDLTNSSLSCQFPGCNIQWYQGNES